MLSLAAYIYTNVRNIKYTRRSIVKAIILDFSLLNYTYNSTNKVMPLKIVVFMQKSIHFDFSRFFETFVVVSLRTHGAR